jgi:periplasmic divalent cation tolerance protein
MTDFLLVLTTVPDQAAGQAIAERLVGDRLAACVTVSAAARSRYRWEGKIVVDEEFVVFIKTRRALYERLEAALKAVHPYTVPEIIALPVELGSKAYLDWLAAETPED